MKGSEGNSETELGHVGIPSISRSAEALCNPSPHYLSGEVLLWRAKSKLNKAMSGILYILHSIDNIMAENDCVRQWKRMAASPIK